MTKASLTIIPTSTSAIIPVFRFTVIEVVVPVIVISTFFFVIVVLLEFRADLRVVLAILLEIPEQTSENNDARVRIPDLHHHRHYHPRLRCPPTSSFSVQPCALTRWH